MLFFSHSVVSDQVFVIPWTAAQSPWTGFPVLHSLLDFAQTHVHWVSDVIIYIYVCMCIYMYTYISSVQSLSCVRLFATP